MFAIEVVKAIILGIVAGQQYRSHDFSGRVHASECKQGLYGHVPCRNPARRHFGRSRSEL